MWDCSSFFPFPSTQPRISCIFPPPPPPLVYSRQKRRRARQTAQYHSWGPARRSSFRGGLHIAAAWENGRAPKRGRSRDRWAKNGAVVGIVMQPMSRIKDTIELHWYVHELICVGKVVLVCVLSNCSLVLLYTFTKPLWVVLQFHVPDFEIIRKY